MLNNKIILGIMVGLLADAMKLTFNYAAFLLGFSEAVYWQLIAALLLEREDVFTPPGLLIGAIADITVTSLLGIIFIYFIYFFGKDILFIKSVGYGMVVWVSTFGVLLTQLIKDTITQDPSGILVTIVAHFIFGLGLYIFTKLLTKNMTLFSQELEEFKKACKRSSIVLTRSKK